MSEATYLSERAAWNAPGIDEVRVAGGVSIHAEVRGELSRITDIGERDGYKVRILKRSDPPEAVVINTGGGLVGGDRIRQVVSVADRAALTVTTQAAERAYRSLANHTTRLDVEARLGEDATLNWLPQETILFDRCRLERRISVEIASTSRLLLAETIVFGRSAMGERLASGLFRDNWRVRRAGKLVYADSLHLGGDISNLLPQRAIADQARVQLALIYVSPDAEDCLACVRKALDGAIMTCGASAWNGFLVVRGLASNTEDVRNAMKNIVPILGNSGLPRIWSG